MGKIREKAKIVSQECLAPGVFGMWIKTEISKEALPGQFISVYTHNESKLLPRPISICETDTAAGTLRIVYRVAGEGTKEFSEYKAGDEIDIFGPLGNGYDLSIKETDASEGKRALLIGGGIGIPPMLELAKRLSCEVTIVAGYRSDKDLFLTEELKNQGNLVIASDDGSVGVFGTVIDAIEKNEITADVIFSCGPKPMLKGVKELGQKMGVPTYISMEERMACGVGACLGCVCKTTQKDDHSKVNNKRICVDGPVFLATEVDL